MNSHRTELHIEPKAGMQQFLFSQLALDSRKRMPPVNTPRGFTARRVSRTRWDGIVSVIFEVTNVPDEPRR